VKHILSLLAITLLAVGCKTVDTPAERCETYSAIYEAYLASTQIGRPISSEEAMGAAAAAIFLRMHCGWAPAVTRSGGGMVDENGVPIIYQP
jgi:hypothetical protein